MDVNQLIEDAVDNLIVESHPALAKLNWLGFRNNRNHNKHTNASSSSAASNIIDITSFDELDGVQSKKQRRKRRKRFTYNLPYPTLTRDVVLSNRKRDIFINNHCRICSYTYTNDIVWSEHKDTKKHKKARKKLLDSLPSKVKQSSKNCAKRKLKSTDTLDRDYGNTSRKKQKIQSYSHNQTVGISDDFDGIKIAFFSSLSPSEYEIIEIKNICNKNTAQIYESILDAKCKAANRQPSQMESFLWHGIKGTNCNDILTKILKNGFDRTYNKVGIFGKGNYFARRAKYSVQNGYCGKDRNNIYFILYCRVLIGHYTNGKKDMNTIPTKSNGQEYDSLVNNKDNPSIFVSWRDYHAIPYYLLKFKKKDIFQNNRKAKTAKKKQSDNNRHIIDLT